MNFQSSWVYSQNRTPVGNMVMNHLLFADDICVFVPSIADVQHHLNTCCDYAV